MYKIPIIQQPGILDQLIGGVGKGIDIANALQRMSMQRKQQEFAEKLQPLQLQYYQAQIEAEKQKGAEKPFGSVMGKAMSDYQNIVSQYGQDSPQAKMMLDYIKKQSMIQPEFAVTGMPGGGFTITKGGLQPILQQPGAQQPGIPGGALGAPTVAGGQQQAPSQAQGVGQPQISGAAQVGAPDTQGLGVMPGKPGQTLFDQGTGEQVSVPTEKMIQKAQSTLMASGPLGAQLEGLYKDISPLLGYSKFIERLKLGYSHYKGMETPTYDKYLSALRSTIPQTADVMLQDMGLNSTGENVKLVQKSLLPEKDDTRYSYASRVTNALVGIAMRDKNYMRMLKSYIPLVEKQSELKTREMLYDKIYNRLLTSIGEKRVAIPEFKNKAEAAGWLAQHNTPSEIEQVRAHLER